MNLITRLQNRFLRREIELEVDEELRHHVDLLLRENIQCGMSPEEARASTLKRFGNLDRVRNECVEICKRSRPLERVLKLGVIFLALIGLIVRFAGTDFHVTRIGDMLIMVAVGIRLLLYVRSLTPSRFLPKNETSSFSIFR